MWRHVSLVSVMILPSSNDDNELFQVISDSTKENTKKSSKNRRYKRKLKKGKDAIS